MKKIGKKWSITLEPFSEKEQGLMQELIDMEQKGIIVQYKLEETIDGSHHYKFEWSEVRKIERYELFGFDN